MFLFYSREGTNLPYRSNLFITRAKRFQSKNFIFDAKKGSFRQTIRRTITRVLGPALITLPMVFQFRIGEEGEKGKKEKNFRRAFFPAGFLSKARATSISSFRRLEQRISPAWRFIHGIFEKNEKRDIGYGLTCASSEISVKPSLPRPFTGHAPSTTNPLFSRRAKIIRAATSATRNPEKSLKRLKAKDYILLRHPRRWKFGRNETSSSLHARHAGWQSRASC